MKRPSFYVLLHEQAGSSLLATLVMIAMMTLMVGSVVVLYAAQYRFIRRDVHRLQARYLAEAGVYVALDSLRKDPFWQARDHDVSLPEGHATRLSVEAFGGYLLVRSEAGVLRSRSTVRAWVGEHPPDAFRKALFLWDASSRVHVAGSTRVVGPLVVGPRGIQTSTFQRRRFTGVIDGVVSRTPDVQPPFIDDRLMSRAIRQLEGLLVQEAGGSSRPSLPARVDRSLSLRLPGDNRVHSVQGDLAVSGADSLLWRAPFTLVAGGNLVVRGPLRFQPGTTFIAGGVLSVGGGVSGSYGLFYGRRGVEVTDSVRCAGQFLSPTRVRVGRGVRLRYPSVLYVGGSARGEEPRIRIEDGAAVDGTIVHPEQETPPGPFGSVVVEPEAHVRGALFNAHATEFHGTLHGALLTHQLWFYESPASYVNWLKDAVIDVKARPVPYLLPVLFSRTPRLEVLRWDAAAEQPDRSR